MPKAPYDKIKARETNRKNYLKNREKRLKNAMEYHWKNREKIIKRHREWYRNKWATNKEWREKNKQRLRDLYRRRIAWYRRREIEYRGTEKWKARYTLSNHVRSRRIIKPNRCDSCQAKCSPHGHHYKGYKYPLAVIWVCRACHGKLHRKS